MLKASESAPWFADSARMVGVLLIWTYAASPLMLGGFGFRYWLVQGSKTIVLNRYARRQS